MLKSKKYKGNFSLVIYQFFFFISLWGVGVGDGEPTGCEIQYVKISMQSDLGDNTILFNFSGQTVVEKVKEYTKLAMQNIL